MAFLPQLLLVALAVQPLGPGDYTRRLTCEQRERTYLLHIPAKCDGREPCPVVLVFHGAGINGRRMIKFSNMNAQADEAGFVVVYPYGTGLANLMLTWNAGGFGRPGSQRGPDDVRFVRTLLDDLGTVVRVDPKRIFAAGHSNGAMMCYRLAAEMPERIAAIAAVSGTLAIDPGRPPRPVSVIHFHGTADRIVPFAGPGQGTPGFLTFKSVEDTVRIWAELTGCPSEAFEVACPDSVEDGTTVKRRTYGPGRQGAEVVLYTIEGGGHTWPGVLPIYRLLGKSTEDISANKLIWEFFQRHPLL